MKAISKKEVSCKALDPVFYYAKQKNVNLNNLIVGLQYDLIYLLNKRERIHWADWCKIISNARAYFSSFEFEEMGSQFVKSDSFKIGLLPAFFIFSSRKISQLIASLILKNSSTMFSCIRQEMEFIKKNQVKITIVIDEGFEICPEFFYISKGYWGELGAKLGQKKFKLIMNLDGRKGIFNASWSKENFFVKIKRRVSWLFNIKKALEEVTDTNEVLSQRYDQLQESKSRLEKQTTQLKTAYEIATQIKQTLHIKDTLIVITDTLVKAAGFDAVRIDLNKDIENNDISIKVQSGTVTESNIPIHREVIANKKQIGDIIAYPSLQMDYADVNELVDYLNPVINIAIHNALVLEAIIDYRNNLEQKVSDRTIELQTASEKLAETNELLRQAHLIQSNFFTNISHEFRTPLTLILGPAKDVLESTNDAKTKHNVSLIKRNAGKLLELVNQLLDISKLESGSVKLKTTPQNIVPLLKTLVHSYVSYAERKRLTLEFKSTEDEIIVYLDKDKIEKIVTNLLSNAFKFTPEGGSIEASVNKNDNYVFIKISDTGVGIPPKKLSKIFDRFYQVDTSHTREHEGTGIGLSLTKELIDLHKGKIEVESKEGKGSTFTVRIPLGKKHLEPDEITEEDNRDVILKQHRKEEIVQSTESVKEFTEFGRDTLSTLLLVEDNTDVRNYIKDNLKNEFRVLEAADGEDGWNRSIEHFPDLIVSDVMMPKMDGFILCEKLKTDERTSHIPIILLTAKATKEDKITGFETGADEYLMKPFEPDELKARIKNLIEQRRRLHEHFKKEGLSEINRTNISSMDKIFMQKVYDLVNDNISDTDFSMDDFAEKLLMSKSLLYKKIVSLTGEPPVEYIRRIRLNKASVLIESNSGNLSEIASEVGFNNPAYFSECFKKQFGVPPSQYKRDKKS